MFIYEITFIPNGLIIQVEATGNNGISIGSNTLHRYWLASCDLLINSRYSLTEYLCPSRSNLTSQNHLGHIHKESFFMYYYFSLSSMHNRQIRDELTSQSQQRNTIMPEMNTGELKEEFNQGCGYRGRPLTYLWQTLRNFNFYLTVFPSLPLLWLYTMALFAFTLFAII